MGDGRPAGRIAVAPDGAPAWMVDAVRAAGGEVVEVHDADALIWGAPGDAAGFGRLIEGNRQLRWIQLPMAGIERYRQFLDHDRTWTCAKAIYAEPVAEMALALALAGFRRLDEFVAADEWGAAGGRNLYDAQVTILGGGGITQALVGLLNAFRCTITVVRNRVEPMDGVAQVVGPDRLHEALGTADLVVVALALTPETDGILDRRAFEAMRRDAWLVNIARGRHVVTDDLVQALQGGLIGGAALDVTDPEPLPAGHPLWELPNCIITPHTANAPEMSRPLLTRMITDNVRRFLAGEPLAGLVDVDAGY